MKRTEGQMKGRRDDAIRSQQQANAFLLTLRSSDTNPAEDQSHIETDFLQSMNASQGKQELIKCRNCHLNAM